MAKNDMDVIVYKILRYLYECMKAGKLPELSDMCYECAMFRIPERYWNQIMMELIDAGYVRGFQYGTGDGRAVIVMTDMAAITMHGVHYLNESNHMAAARQFLGKGFEIALGAVIGTIIK